MRTIGSPSPTARKLNAIASGVQGEVNDRQACLTAGQSHFVQTGGALTTTSGNPSVFAGTAISATNIIVKG